MFDNIILLHPWALLLLPIYFIVELLFRQKNPTIYFSNIKGLKKVQKKRGLFTPLTKFFALLFMVLALSSPAVTNNVKTDYAKGYDIGLLVDASLSMNDNDKFLIMKKILKQFILKRKHDRLSLIVFGDYARVASPLTYNKKTLLRALKFLKTGIAGDRQTSIYETIFVAIDLFKGVKTHNKIMILLTDGRNTIGKIPLHVAIQVANKHHIKIYTVGIGNKGDFDSKVLKKIADKTGGRFYEANNEKSLLKIYGNIDLLTKDTIQTRQYLQIRYLFEYPAFISLGFIFMLLIIERRKYVF